MPTHFARFRSARRTLLVAAPAFIACAATACGLSLSGTMATTDDAGVAVGDASNGGDAPTAAEGGSPLGDGATADATDGASGVDGGPDAPFDAPPEACVPFDSGATGPLALSAFVLKGDSSYNENNDGKITLTNSNNNEHGAAWYPIATPALGAFDLTWTLRVGPGDTAGDGLAFVVVQASGVPDVGDDGNGIGLRNLMGTDGGAVTGYAVVVDMYKDGNDPTDLEKTTLKLVAMPSFTYVTGIAVPVSLNDGNNYAVDVSWRAPSALTATLHGPGGANYVVTSNDARFTTLAHAYIGFTASTGAAADSHNEIAGITVTSVCH